jgi:hypothetical protein
MNFPITLADLPATQDVRLLGATPDLVVVEAAGERFACDRTTGEPTSLPASFTPLPPAPTESTAGTARFAIRTALPTIARDGRIVFDLRTSDARIRVDGVLLPGLGALGLAAEGGRWPSLEMTLIGATGELVGLRLPVWTVNSKSDYDLDASIPWTLVVEPTARVVAVMTPHRATWITLETLAGLFASDVQTVGVAPARRPHLALASFDAFSVDRGVSRYEAVGDIAARLVHQDVLHRCARLRALGMATDLDDAAVADYFASSVLLPRGRHDFSFRGQIDPAALVSEILASYFATRAEPDLISGDAAALRAARANRARSTSESRFRSFATSRKASQVFVALSAEVRTAIVDEALLLLDPEPPPPPELDPGDPVSVAQALNQFAPGIYDIALRGEEVVLRLSPDSAHRLYQALEKPI